MHSIKDMIYKLIIFTGLFIISSNLSAQKVDIDSSTPLHFGKFFKTSGGNIIIDPVSGDVNSDGDIITVIDGIRGTITVSTTTFKKFENKTVNVTILTPTVYLNSIVLLIVDVYPKSFQFDPNDPKQTIYLGGTLQVGGNEHPVGVYTNISDMIFIQFDVAK